MKHFVFLPLLLNIKPLHIILMVVVIVLLIAAAIITVFLVKGKKKTPAISNSDWLTALGDKDNIKEVSAVGSRLSVSLLDNEKIDREKLKELGVSSILVMSNKVTLVIEDKAALIAESIQEEL